MLIISIIMSRLHIAGYLIIFCLLFFRLDFSVLSMLRFYKKYPERLNQIYHPQQQREMWTQAGKIVQEAASNPQVQTVAVGVMGALAWKVLDIHDVHTQQEIATTDGISKEKIAEADRIAENKRHFEEIEMRKAELEAENKHHFEKMEMRKAELEAENNSTLSIILPIFFAPFKKKYPYNISRFSILPLLTINENTTTEELKFIFYNIFKYYAIIFIKK